MSSAAKYVIATVVGMGAVAAAAGAAFIWSGAYNIGADSKHTAPVESMLETVRKRSIQVRAADLQVPDLKDEARIVQGAGNYNAMCVGCHLAPGMKQTELSRGLYPEPPNLTKTKVEPAHAFWVIKHGIKASGMAAWGKSMKDDYVWNMAAFLQRLPELDQRQYRQMVASSGGHSHGGGESGDHHSGETMKDRHGGDAADDHHGEDDAMDHHEGDSREAPSHGAATAAPGVQPQEPANSTAAKSPASTPAGHHDDGHKH